jgi:hypothetical protein
VEERERGATKKQQKECCEGGKRERERESVKGEGRRVIKVGTKLKNKNKKIIYMFNK